MQDHHREQRHRDYGDDVADLIDGLAGPEQAEVTDPQQAAHPAAAWLALPGPAARPGLPPAFGLPRAFGLRPALRALSAFGRLPARPQVHVPTLDESALYGEAGADGPVR